jgi:uncharacterized protein YecE (DUF72 family)
VAPRRGDDGRTLIGCSGWAYAAWRGRFYPTGLPQRSWLEHYASRFATVESNASFYRLPTTDTVRGWAERVPDGFVVSVKLGQFGSHRMKLKGATRWLPNHVTVMTELGVHLGPTLVQLPPRWRRDLGRLDEFLHVARDLAPTWRWAVELRDPSWVHDDTVALLERYGAALCLHDLLPRHPLALTTSWTYLRFHGPHATQRPYTGRYGPRRLASWADRINAWSGDGIDIYAYFNNDVDGAAPLDATWLAHRSGPGFSDHAPSR